MRSIYGDDATSEIAVHRTSHAYKVLTFSLLKENDMFFCRKAFVRVQERGG